MRRILSFSIKSCPYCAEAIKRRAVVCRFCGYDLRSGKPTRPSLAQLQDQQDQQDQQYQQGEQDQSFTQEEAHRSLGCGLFIIAGLLFIGVCVVLSLLL